MPFFFKIREDCDQLKFECSNYRFYFSFSNFKLAYLEDLIINFEVFCRFKHVD
jgi:hypothetical protein